MSVSRLSLLIVLALAGCPSEGDKPTTHDTGVDDTAPPTETDTSEPIETGDSGAASPTYTIVWRTVVSSTATFHDIVPSGDGAYYLGSPKAEGKDGAIYSIDASTSDLADAPKWTGQDGQQIGIGVSTFELPGEGRVIATAEYASDEGFAGRYLVAPDDGIGGVMADHAVVNILGPVSGGPSTGGFFGEGSALWDGEIYVSQTNAEPALHRGSAAAGLTLADMEPVEGIDGDPVADGGQGYVASVVRSTGFGLLACHYGGVCQHIGADGPDWYLADGIVTMGELDLSTVDRDTSTKTYVSTVFGYYSITVLTADYEQQYALVLDDDGETILTPPDYAHMSVTAGTTEDGISWTAYGVTGRLEDTPDDLGLVHLIAGPRGGDIWEGYITLPLESPYYCAFPRLVSDEVDEIALICQDDAYAMIGTVVAE